MTGLKLGNYEHYKSKPKDLKHYEVLGVGRFDRKIDTDKPFAVAYHSEDQNSLRVYSRAGEFIITPKEAGVAGLDYVVYKALYYSELFGRNSIWVRPLEMFLQTVTVDGKEVPRFRYLGPSNDLVMRLKEHVNELESRKSELERNENKAPDSLSIYGARKAYEVILARLHEKFPELKNA